MPLRRSAADGAGHIPALSPSQRRMPQRAGMTRIKPRGAVPWQRICRMHRAERRSAMSRLFLHLHARTDPSQGGAFVIVLPTLGRAEARPILLACVAGLAAGLPIAPSLPASAGRLIRASPLDRPAAVAYRQGHGAVAQWLEPGAHNALVGGSSPSGPTTTARGMARILSDRIKLARIGIVWHARSIGRLSPN